MMQLNDTELAITLFALRYLEEYFDHNLATRMKCSPHFEDVPGSVGAGDIDTLCEKLNTSYIRESQGVTVPLENGNQIVSGWIDTDDPDALEAGDYLSVERPNGEQVFYMETADLVADPVDAKTHLLNFLQACRSTE